MVTGFTEDDSGNGVIIMDPSEIDGGIKNPSWEELEPYVTPECGIPVTAWGIKRTSENFEKSQENCTANKGYPGFELLHNPLWRDEDTGIPLPTGTEHTTSSVMPTSALVKQWMRLNNIVLSSDGKRPYGYPRFVVPPAVKRLAYEAAADADELPFPSLQSARAAAYLEKVKGTASGAEIAEHNGLYWLRGTKLNLDAWQNTGLGLSSRQAEAAIHGHTYNKLQRRNEAEETIKATIASFYNNLSPSDIYLFPTGMAAIYWLNQALIKCSKENAPAVQFGFPYTDTFNQRRYGPTEKTLENSIDLRNADYDELAKLANTNKSLRCIMTEYPSNPLLRTPDFQRIDSLAGDKVPIVIDDTVGTMYNLDDSRLPNSVAARVTSLTKYFSSVGDVMGGSVVLRRDSPHYPELKAALDSLYEDTLWYEDAEKLAENCIMFERHMEEINKNGEEMANFCQEQTGPNGPLKATYHPSIVEKGLYDAVRHPMGGYGGLMSLEFNDPQRAFRFFDLLKVTKGPSLGTYYTLGCLYTLLAHRTELDTAAKFGVKPDLVRLSIGIEDRLDLKERFRQAFIDSE